MLNDALKSKMLYSFTSNHCVNRIPAFDKFLVKLGVHFLNETADDAEVTMRINQIDIHENYDQLTKVETLFNHTICNNDSDRDVDF
jgi:hypothetical protein